MVEGNWTVTEEKPPTIRRLLTDHFTADEELHVSDYNIYACLKGIVWLWCVGWVVSISSIWMP